MDKTKNKAYRPTPEEVKQARKKAGLTQQQAAELLGVGLKGFQHCEYGIRVMPASTWELFLLKTDQHETLKLTSKED